MDGEHYAIKSSAGGLQLTVVGSHNADGTNQPLALEGTDAVGRTKAKSMDGPAVQRLRRRARRLMPTPPPKSRKARLGPLGKL